MHRKLLSFIKLFFLYIELFYYLIFLLQFLLKYAFGLFYHLILFFANDSPSQLMQFSFSL